MNKKIKEKQNESRFSDECRKKIARKICTFNTTECVNTLNSLVRFQDCFTENDFKFMISNLNKRARILAEHGAESKKDCSVDQYKKYDKRRREYRDNKK